MRADMTRAGVAAHSAGNGRPRSAHAAGDDGAGRTGRAAGAVAPRRPIAGGADGPALATDRARIGAHRDVHPGCRRVTNDAVCPSLQHGNGSKLSASRCKTRGAPDRDRGCLRWHTFNDQRSTPSTNRSSASATTRRSAAVSGACGGTGSPTGYPRWASPALMQAARLKRANASLSAQLALQRHRLVPAAGTTQLVQPTLRLGMRQAARPSNRRRQSASRRLGCARRPRTGSGSQRLRIESRRPVLVEASLR